MRTVCIHTLCTVSIKGKHEWQVACWKTSQLIPRSSIFAGTPPPRPNVQRSYGQTFGDIGHVDADGYLYLTDRLDDMIISGDVNIYPQEIEAALRGTPGVWDVAVVGVPDARFGERPVAFVVPDRHALSDPAGLRATIERQCAEDWAATSVPMRSTSSTTCRAPPPASRCAGRCAT